MRDSNEPGSIPIHGTELVAGYINGKYAWTQENFDRFRGIPHIFIDIFGDNPHAGVLDVEPQCAKVEDAPPWVKARKALLPDAHTPVIYCNRSTLTPLFNAMAAAGLHVVHDFRLWIATLDGTRKVADMTGVVAVQYKRARNQDKNGHFTEEPGPAVTEGHFDESIVHDDQWHHHA
jgi:hypothetical protein